LLIGWIIYSQYGVYKMVDHSALKTNQTFIIVLVSAAYLVESPLLVALVALVMLAGTAWLPAAAFQQFYRLVLQPTGLVKPRVREDRLSPHLFAQGFGGMVLVAALLSLTVLDMPQLGWGLSLMVVVLAMVNLFAEFCAGCFVFYQLERLGLIGAPPKNS